MSSFGRRTAPATVLVNVYDLAAANDFLFPVGLGAYHSGVEIGGSEYTFAEGAGVVSHAPRAVPDNAPFRQQIDLGQCDAARVPAVLATLKASDRFGPHAAYHILRNNCNHFTRALVWALLQKPVPPYINRLADAGACCSCLIPKQLLLQNNAPKEESRGEQTRAFLVKAPANRTILATNNNSSAAGSTTATTTAAFQGRGAKLGGGSSLSSSSSAAGADALTDRREKARLAALARLERQQQQGNDGDKSH